MTYQPQFDLGTVTCVSIKPIASEVLRS